MASDLLRILMLATLASSVALLLALALRKVMRARFGARAAYALWALVPLSAFVALLPSPVASISMQIIPMAAVGPAAPLVVVALPATNPLDLSPWLAATWLLGICLVGYLFVRQQRRFVHGLGQLSVAGDETMRAQTTAGCPALLGALHPRVVVPADFEQRYSATERELILAHERTHRARGDAQINALAAALRCIFWFNPLIHFAALRFRFDQELACDAVVISRFPEARRSYAEAMLKTQMAADPKQFGELPVGCHWQSSHPLKERIAMLKQPLPGRARAALGITLAAALVMGGTYAAWAAQPPAAESEVKTASSNATDSKAAFRKLRRIAYPAELIAAKMEGVVYVKAHIGVDGNVSAASVDRIDPSSAAALGEVAVAGVKTWTFEPAQKQGKPVASDEIIPVVFALNAQTKPKVTGGTFDAIRVSPPDSAATTQQSKIEPATENISYRIANPPKYPQAALDANLSGKLVLKVLVGEKGEPKSAIVYTAEPPTAQETFGEAAIAAVMKWKFNPPLRDGKPYESYALVPVDFAVNNDEG